MFTINSVIMILMDVYLAYINGRSLWFSLSIGAFFFIIWTAFFLVVPLIIGKKTKPEDPYSIFAVVQVPVSLIISALMFTFSILSLKESEYNYVIVFASMGFFTLFLSIVWAQRAMGKVATNFAFLALASLIPAPFVIATSPNQATSFPPIFMYIIGILLIVLLTYIAIHRILKSEKIQPDNKLHTNMASKGIL